MDSGIKIGIEVAGGQESAAEVNQVAAATERLGATTEKQSGSVDQAAAAQARLGDKTEETAKSQEDFGRKAQASTQVLEGLKMASAGGASAVFGLGKALEGMLSVVGLAGPWGKALTAAAALVSALAVAMNMLRDDSKKAADGAEADGDRIKKAWEEAGAELSKRREVRFSEQLDQIRAKADEAAEAVSRLMAARDRMASAEMGAELETNANDARLTPEERRVNELEIRHRYARKQEEERAGAIDEPVRAAREAEMSTRNAVASRQRALDRTQEDLARPDREIAAATAEIERLSRELLKEGDTAKRQQLEDAIQAATDRKDSFAVDPVWRERMTQQASDQQKALEAAQQQLAEAERGRRQAEEVAATEREVQTKEREANERARQSSMGAAQSARAAKVATGQATPEDPLERPALDTYDSTKATAAARSGRDVAARALERSSAGQGTAYDRALADAARAATDTLSRLEDGATSGELVAALKAIADFWRLDTNGKDRIELQRVARELQRLQSQMARGRNN